jgi:hypothetical protein
MATNAQITANRANARRSTGPRSVEGKSASSMNALKHGADAASIIIPGEDPAAYEALAADYRRDLKPSGAVEDFQVDTIIHADWQRRRLQRVEAKLYRELIAEGATPDDIDVAPLRDSKTGKLLIKVWGQIAKLERAHGRALAALRRLRSEAGEAAAQSVDPPTPKLEVVERNEANAKPESGDKPGAADPIKVSRTQFDFEVKLR